MRTFTSAMITAAMLFAASAHAQYCMLPGRTPYSSIQPGISNFKLNTINRSSVPVESMSAVVVTTGDTTTLLPGHTYTVTITHTRDSVIFPTVRNNIRVWIDYNGDGDFDDAGETPVSSDYQTYGVYTNTFTVPATATLGYTRLRATAKMSSEGGHSIPTSCDMPADPIGYHGEMEDYVVKIAAPTAVNVTGSNGGDVAVFPNPTARTITLQFDHGAALPVSADLLDMTGKCIARLIENVQAAPMCTVDLNIYSLAPGVYTVRVMHGGAYSYHKVVKTN